MSLQQQKSNFIPLPPLDTTRAKMLFPFLQMKRAITSAANVHIAFICLEDSGAAPSASRCGAAASL